jgi:hypothetical protein
MVPDLFWVSELAFSFRFLFEEGSLSMKKQWWLTRFLACSSLAAAALVIGTGGSVMGETGGIQSDTSGTFINGSVVPGYLGTFGDRLDAATLAEAQRLSDVLSEAYTACVESMEVAASLPRRFSVRGPSDPTCMTSQCAAYESLLRETEQFVSEVEDDIADIDRFYPDRVW